MGRGRYDPAMSGRSTPRSLGAIALRGLALDASLVLVWRFGWKHSWATCLIFGGVLVTLTCAMTVYTWWWRRHPEVEQRMLAKQGDVAEKRAQDAAALEAATRAAGRERFRR